MKRLLTPLFTLSVVVFIGLLIFTPAHAQDTVTFTDFPITMSNSGPYDLVAGPDGNLWFTDLAAKIGRITPSGAITEFPVGSSDSSPLFITPGPDGNLWFTEATSNTGKIGRITPDGVITEFPLPADSYKPEGITTGPDGNLWFTESAWNTGKIGRITPKGTITEFSLPSDSSITTGINGSLWSGNSSNPFSITTGPDGNLWFTEDGYITSSGGQVTGGIPFKIGRVTPDGVITEFPLLTASYYYHRPNNITPSQDGNLWFTEDGGSLGRISTSGVISEFPVASASAFGITSGPDGNIWFTEGSKIGRVTPDGSPTEFSLSTSSESAQFITNGPDGNLWFTANDKIVRVNLSGITPTITPTPTQAPTLTPPPTIKVVSGVIIDANGNLVRKTGISVTCNGQTRATTTNNGGTFKVIFNNACSVGSNVTVIADLGVPYKPGTKETGSGIVKVGGSLGRLLLTSPIEVPAKAQTVINWATPYYGQIAYYDVKNKVGLCLQFVRDAWNAAGVDITKLDSGKTAIDYWNNLPKNTKHLWLGPTDKSIPPAGALVFWNVNPWNKDGHVAISLGDGSVISTEAFPYFNEKGKFDTRVFIFYIINNKPTPRDPNIYKYLGWMMPQ